MLFSSDLSSVKKAIFHKRKHFAVCVFALLIVCFLHVVKASDESESLVLLVKTLEVSDDPAVRIALLQGILSGLEGRRQVKAPKGWSELSKKLARSKDENVRDLSMQLSQIFGDVAATQRTLSILKDASADSKARRTALHTLLTLQNKEVSLLLESLLDEPTLRLDAIRGYAMIENSNAPAILLRRYKQLSPELRRAVIETLATRKNYARSLLDAIREKKISRDEIPAHVARALHDILGDRFVKVFGKVRPIAEDREKLMSRYRKLITPNALANADASRGRAVFKKTCAACHLLYDEGGKIGPDLTGSNRANLDYILLNSVDPSYDVPDAYKTVTIATVDGRVINGVLAAEDGSRVVLKTVEQPRVVVAKEDIELRKISPKSMMPDGQLEKLRPQEVIDLISYLRTTEQVEIAK